MIGSLAFNREKESGEHVNSGLLGKASIRVYKSSSHCAFSSYFNQNSVVCLHLPHVFGSPDVPEPSKNPV